ncbi:MAG: class I SAM-dependent methyltransferase [Dethiobacter sp.]|jgi:SAM-dependent methyltransferase|nr:class I SAM-dependent methyltransferase [Dethiobacter sp.]
MMKPATLFDAIFWQTAWDEANAENRKRKQAQKAVDAWDRRAKSFERNVNSNSGKQRVGEVLAFLDTYGALYGRLRILDLGCGPGYFSLAFAERGHEVVALDPSETMLSLLEEKLSTRPELRTSVKKVVADWIVLDLDEFGWRGYFDLVFASMTPGIRDVDTLQKAMAASKRYVYLSSFAGPRIQPSVGAVWQHFNDKPYSSLSMDILFPQNWLYAAGYRPSLHFVNWAREHSQPVEEAVEEIKDMLALRMDIDQNVEDYILAHVESRADADGRFSEYKGATSAMLLWDIEKKVMPRLSD